MFVAQTMHRLEKTPDHQLTFTDLPQELKQLVDHSPKLSENTIADDAVDGSQAYAPPAVRYKNQRPFSDERLGESYVVHVWSSEDLESSLHPVHAPEAATLGVRERHNTGEGSSDEGWALIDEQTDEHSPPPSPDMSVFRSALADSAIFSSFFK